MKSSLTQENTLRAESVSFKYGKVQALKEVSLELQPGQFCVLMGENGSGKTTLLNLLAGNLVPNSGRAMIGDFPTTKDTPSFYQKLGFVSFHQNLPQSLTLLQVLKFLRPLYPDWDLSLEKTLVDFFQLPLDRKVEGFSQGMQMKARLLFALCYRPSVLLLDEPFGGFDALSQSAFVDVLLDLMGEYETTIVCVTHHLHEVSRLAERLVFLSHGKIALDESVETLLARHRKVVFPSHAPDTLSLSDFVVSPNPQRLQGIAEQFTDDWKEAILKNHQVPREQIEISAMSLSDIALHLQHKFAK